MLAGLSNIPASNCGSRPLQRIASGLPSEFPPLQHKSDMCFYTGQSVCFAIFDVQFRTIGAVPVDGFAVTHLVHDYDALIYFDHSSPSVLLPF
jgi:hypothetical protein